MGPEKIWQNSLIPIPEVPHHNGGPICSVPKPATCTTRPCHVPDQSPVGSHSSSEAAQGCGKMIFYKGATAKYICQNDPHIKKYIEFKVEVRFHFELLFFKGLDCRCLVIVGTPRIKGVMGNIKPFLKSTTTKDFQVAGWNQCTWW